MMWVCDSPGLCRFHSTVRFMRGALQKTRNRKTKTAQMVLFLNLVLAATPGNETHTSIGVHDCLPLPPCSAPNNQKCQTCHKVLMLVLVLVLVVVILFVYPSVLCIF
jgi:hypothetical protein